MSFAGLMSLVVAPADNDFVYHVIRRPRELLHRIGARHTLTELIATPRLSQTTLRNNNHRARAHRCTQRERPHALANAGPIPALPDESSSTNCADSRLPVTPTTPRKCAHGWCNPLPTRS